MSAGTGRRSFQPTRTLSSVDSPRDEITELLHTYAERIDAGDFEGVGDLFADAEITFEGFDQVHRGRDEVQALYGSTTRRYGNGTPRTRHLITNVIVEVDEQAGSATARSYFTVLQGVPGRLALQPIIAGRYHDRFAHQDGMWRFRSRHTVVDLIGDLGHHLLVDFDRPADG
jgi:3-phenylpropionate/cinnamic acid dioxygenase small subunit